MFGLLRPSYKALPSQEQKRHMAEYCNVCGSLGYRYGIASRPLVVHDLATLAWMIQGDQAQTAPFKSFNCIKGGARLQNGLTELPARQELIAALSATTISIKLEDDIEDSNSLMSRATNSLYKNAFGMAADDLARTGFDLGGLREHLERQRQVEADKERDLSVASCATGNSYAMAATAIASHTPGGIGACNASEFGRFIGQVVYVTDALRDYSSDIGRSYNPLHRGSSDSKIREQSGQQRLLALDYLFTTFQKIRLLAQGISQNLVGRWLAVEEHITGQLKLSNREVILYSSCCIPCGPCFVSCDGADCNQGIGTCICCCICAPICCKMLGQ